jgi:site-specific DNA-methyltransferase (adenine-specific)
MALRVKPKYTVINGDCLRVLSSLPEAKCIFADPPDNLGLGYGSYNDRRPKGEYTDWLAAVVRACVFGASVSWISFNPKWYPALGYCAALLIEEGYQFKPCVQTFTFGQHNHHDLGGNHRPLWRFSNSNAVLYPENIRIPSWRQENGDKRADPRGRVPGDVFDFPRVTGNSKQRRAWCPTQLNEKLVERCILLSTRPGDLVIDPFGGTGTTMRVCKRLRRSCTVIEIDPDYCERIRADNHSAINPIHMA